LPLPPGSLAYLDAKNGFRDLTFGDPPTPDMQLTEESGDFRTYVRATDDLTIGEAHLQFIAYRFYKNRFGAAVVGTKGYANSVALLEVLRQAYGQGDQPNQFLHQYFWHGSRVWVSYDRKLIGDETIAVWRSLPLYRERQAEEKEKAKKGIGGL
jgi:hypothetical protein